MIALGYAGEPEVQVLAELGEGEICDSALNLRDRSIYRGTGDLESALNKILG